MMSGNAKLLFDSDRTSGQMGLRSIVSDDRSLLFAAGPMIVDLVVYDSSDEMRVVHGQILDRADETPVAGALVRLGEDGESDETDEFGQFTVSVMLPCKQMVLAIQAEGADEIRCGIPATDESLGVTG